MNNFKKLLYIITISLLCSHKVAFSEQVSGAVSLTPGMSWFFFDDDRNLKDRPLFNVAMAYNFNKCFSLEGTYGYIRTKDKTDKENSFGRLIMFSGLYNYRLCNYWVPYAVAGVQCLKLDDKGEKNHNHRGGHVGLGIKYFVSKSAALRTDFRVLRHKGHIDTYTDYLWNIGFMMQFGCGANC